MNIRDYAVANAAYNVWMNDKLYRAAGGLPDHERKRNLGAFFKSIHGTLNHLLVADQSWMQRFARQTLTMTSPDQELFAEFGELTAARRKMDQTISEWAAELGEDFARMPLRFYSVTYKREHTIPGWAAVVHLFNHQTHHRAQAFTLLTQLGQDAGVTDFPWMPYFDDGATPAGSSGGPPHVL
jgi:uncharacterized damage-inducible protein DinB